MPDAPGIIGIHHVKFPVSDLAASQQWYERVFGLSVDLEFRDEPDGAVKGLVFAPIGGVVIALRENREAAAGVAGFDPVSFAVEDRGAAEEWARYLDRLGIAHSPIIDATIGWLIVFNDPDGLELHLYTAARHGLERTGDARAGQPPAASTDQSSSA